VAKRFRDTGIWDRAWYRALKPKMKCAVDFLFDRCDAAGVWPCDFAALSFFVGEEVTEEEILQALGKKIRKLPNGDLFLTQFVEFQYGELKATNNAHRSVLRLLERHGISAPPQPLRCPSGGDQEKDKEKEKERGSGGKPTPEQVSACVEQWAKSLRHWKNPKPAKADDHEIYRLIAQFGFEPVLMALAGFRGEKKSGDFDPGRHLAFSRVRDRDKRERLVNLGAKVLAEDERRSGAPSASEGYSEKSWDEALGGTA
jgi:hypothetical protein